MSNRGVETLNTNYKKNPTITCRPIRGLSFPLRLELTYSNDLSSLKPQWRLRWVVTLGNALLVFNEFVRTQNLTQRNNVNIESRYVNVNQQMLNCQIIYLNRFNCNKESPSLSYVSCQNAGNDSIVHGGMPPQASLRSGIPSWSFVSDLSAVTPAGGSEPEVEIIGDSFRAINTQSSDLGSTFKYHFNYINVRRENHTTRYRNDCSENIME